LFVKLGKAATVAKSFCHREGEPLILSLPKDFTESLIFTLTFYLVNLLFLHKIIVLRAIRTRAATRRGTGQQILFFISF